MSSQPSSVDLQFLSGGGEMGALTRAKDWSRTSVGNPDQWPQSLRTTLSIILHSRFPMFLWWGPELTCFYNDAYRPSLGNNGKHPGILGEPAETAWTEIWPIIKPLIDQVLNGGEATWSEDQLIPIYRNGKLEDVYWTFSYSPVTDESGKVAGVLVTCTETTDKVQRLAEIKEREDQLQFTINAADLGTWDLNPATNRFVGNALLKEWFGLAPDDEIELTVALNAIHDKDRERVINTIQQVLKSGSDGNYNISYTIVHPLTKKETKVLAKGKALFNEDNIAYRFSGILQDITAHEDAHKKMEESGQRVRTIVESAPFPIGVYVGKEMRIELANQSILDIWGKGNDVIGKLYAEVLPELENQAIFGQLDYVFTTGNAFHAQNQHLDLVVDGKTRPYYFNYSFTPLYDSSGNIYGVMNTAADVTALNVAKKQTEESDKRFRNTVKQAPLGITILRGEQFIVEMANETYLQIVDRNEKDFVGHPLFDSLPEVEDIVKPLLDDVIKTGVPFQSPELSVMLKRYGKEELGYFNLVYHPLREENGEISGIMVVAAEVTESVIAKHSLAEREQQLRNLVMQSPIPMTIFRGEDFIIEMANTIMYENIWRKKQEEIEGKKVMDVFPELKEQKYEALLREVYRSGKRYSEKESLAHVQGDNGMQKFYLDYEYAPLFGTDAKVSGIIITVNDVTEKVEARIKVENSEKEYKELAERLNIVIDASELGTWEWDIATDIIKYSDKYLEIFNYDETDDLGKHKKHLASIHRDDRALRNEALEEAFRTGILHYQLRIIWKDKSIHWIEAKGKVFYGNDHRPVKLIGTIREITDEKAWQQELFENEQRFRLLADSMPQQIWTADPQGNLNYYNRAVFYYSGLNLEQINSGGGWIQIVHPDDRDENIRQWMEAITTGTDFLFEHRFLRHDGEYRWQLSRAIPQRDSEGNIQMWVGTSTDIQEQKMFAAELEKKVLERTKELGQLNESLRKSEERYHLMVEEVQDYAILYLNRSGIVENWNKGAEKIKGYHADEIIGKSFSEFYTLRDKQNNLPERLLEQARISGKAVQEGERVRKNGSIFWASVVITAVHDEQGNVIGFSKVTHDLTEKKAAQDAVRMNAEQLAQKNAELEKMNTELQSFAYVSSHDLQEPLRKIQTFASRILSKEMTTLSENGKDYFRRMQDAAGRMQTLIQDLLAYSRTSTTDRVYESVDFADIVTDVKNDIRETLAEKNATIKIKKMCKVHVIPFQFRQLLHNLFGNSLKFARPGVPPCITINCELVKGSALPPEIAVTQKMYCHISISDNGIGFDEMYRERIFEIFQRLHGKEEYSGTGIGLAIVKKIVENHNGIIIAGGELNKGATFDIYIPA